MQIKNRWPTYDRKQLDTLSQKIKKEKPKDLHVMAIDQMVEFLEEADAVNEGVKLRNNAQGAEESKKSEVYKPK